MHYAFRGLAMSLRRTNLYGGASSAQSQDILVSMTSQCLLRRVIAGAGCDDCHRPRSQRTLTVGSHRLRFPAGVFVHFLR